MHDADLSFVPLLIVIALSFAVPVALSPIRRFGIPVIVGEIAAGIAVGQSGLNLVAREPVLNVLSVFGFAYLMFLSGLEMDFSQIPRRQRGLRSVGGVRRATHNPFFLGGSMFGLTVLCSTAAGFYLQFLGLVDDPWLMALILSTTSLGVVAPVLKERGLMASRYGQALLVCALIADFATILLISSYVVLRSSGPSLEIMLVLLLILAFLVAYRVAARFRRHVPAQQLMRLLSTATSQIQVRGSLAIALVFIGLAQSLGIEDILGAFLAGVIVAILAGDQSSVLKQKLDAIGYGFFIPVFFIMVGVTFDLPALLGSGSALQLVLLLIVVAYGVKLLAGTVFKLVYTWRDTIAAGTLLSARLSLIIAVAAIGRQIGAITPAFEAAIILTAIITCLVSPIAFARLTPRAEAGADTVLVVGAGEDADALIEHLRRLPLDTIAAADLPVNPTQTKTGAAGTSSNAMMKCLREAGIDRASVVVVMTDHDAQSLQICRLTRAIRRVKTIVAWVHDPGLNSRFTDTGAQVVNPGNFKVLALESVVLSGRALIPANKMGERREIRAVKLRNWGLREQQLRNLMLPHSVSVLSIQRGGRVIIPSPDTPARANDVFILSGDAAAVDAFARRLARPL